VVVGTTDVHGWFAGREQQQPRYGGLPLFASYVKVLRAEHDGNVIVVDSGDIFQGTLESNLFEGEPLMHGYNEIGYTAVAVGNHEFDYGPVGPNVVAKTPSEDPLGALKRNASIATFPFLSANMTVKATGQTPEWARKSVIVSAGGVQIGIIGLSTPDTPNTTMEANVRSLSFADPVQATIDEARELRARGADVIIVIAHVGGRCTDVRDEHDLASCDRQQHAFQYLMSLPPGTIDAYFGGHTHAQMRQVINGIPAVQALPYSQEFSTLDLWVDPRQNRVERWQIRPHTMICGVVFSGTERCDARNAPANAHLVPRLFLGRTITPDPRVKRVLQPYLDRTEAKRNEPLGITTAARFRRSYLQGSELGSLLTDALRLVTGADIAFMNSGGIRAELRAGDLVYSDVFEVSPFDNFPAVVMMTGAQIRDLLRIMSTGERGVMQSSGLRYAIDEAKDQDKPAAERDRVASVAFENGEPLDPDKLYKVAMPDFVAAGGDATAPLMRQIPPERMSIDQSRPLREIFIEGLRRMPQPLVPPAERRITILNAKPAPARD
jgi:5'-nucleotidase